MSPYDMLQMMHSDFHILVYTPFKNKVLKILKNRTKTSVAWLKEGFPFYMQISVYESI